MTAIVKKLILASNESERRLMSQQVRKLLVPAYFNPAFIFQLDQGIINRVKQNRTQISIAYGANVLLKRKISKLIYFSPNVVGCCTHGLVFKDHASFPRIPFRKCLLEIVRYICRILGVCSVAALKGWCQDIECKWQSCAFGNNKFQPMRSPKVQKKRGCIEGTEAQKLKFFMTPPSFIRFV